MTMTIPQPPSYPEPPRFNPVENPKGQPPQKSKLAARLFGLFLGSLGIHNFYLGYTGKAITQLLLTLLSIGVLAFVSAVWGLIEGILILVSKPGEKWHQDAQGVELRD